MLCLKVLADENGKERAESGKGKVLVEFFDLRCCPNL